MTIYKECRNCQFIKCFKPFRCMKGHAYNPFLYMKPCEDWTEKEQKTIGVKK